MFGGAQIREAVRINHQSLACSTAGVPLIFFLLVEKAGFYSSINFFIEIAFSLSIDFVTNNDENCL